MVRRTEIRTATSAIQGGHIRLLTVDDPIPLALQEIPVPRIEAPPLEEITTVRRVRSPAARESSSVSVQPALTYPAIKAGSLLYCHLDPNRPTEQSSRTRFGWGPGMSSVFKELVSPGDVNYSSSGVLMSMRVLGYTFSAADFVPVAAEGSSAPLIGRCSVDSVRSRGRVPESSIEAPMPFKTILMRGKTGTGEVFPMTGGLQVIADLESLRVAGSGAPMYGMDDGLVRVYLTGGQKDYLGVTSSTSVNLYTRRNDWVIGFSIPEGSSWQSAWPSFEELGERICVLIGEELGEGSGTEEPEPVEPEPVEPEPAEEDPL